MLKTTLSPVANWLRGLAIAVGVCAGSANAATYSGVWDPPFGSPFNNLGWAGQALFEVPETCDLAGASAGFIFNFNPACAGQAVVTSAQVTLTNLTSNASTTLVFNPSSMYIFALDYTASTLTDLITTNSNFIDPSTTLGGAFNWNTQFSLFFDLGGPHLMWRECGSYSSDDQYRTNYSSYESHGVRCRYGVNDSRNFPPDFTITRVPEPGSLALVGLAILALPLTKRRGERGAARL